MSDPTIEDIRSAVDVLKANSVRPHTVKTAKQAKYMNKVARALGLSCEWKVGDKYYIMYTDLTAFIKAM